MYKYTQVIPSDCLKPFIECFWIMKKSNSGKPLTNVLAPNACSEVVFAGGYGYKRYDKKNDVINFVEGLQVIGPRSNYIEVTEIQDGSIDIGFIFKPYGLKPFVNEVRQLVNKVFSLNEIISKPNFDLNNNIRKEIDAYKKIELLENYFENLINPKNEINSIIEEAVSNIHTLKGNIKIYELQRNLKVSKSTLERIFYRNIGISPKEFTDIWRLNYFINSQKVNQADLLTELAFDYGFFDQSHFIKFFKKHTGNTPKGYFSSDYNLTNISSIEVENRFRVY